MAKILLVENDFGNAEVIQLILEDQCIQVKCIHETAVLDEMISTFAPDLILMDILLDNCDGRVLCNALKANPATLHIPVLLITAMLESEAYAVKNKADAMMFKPFEYDKLSEKISDLITHS